MTTRADVLDQSSDARTNTVVSREGTATSSWANPLDLATLAAGRVLRELGAATAPSPERIDRVGDYLI